MIGPVNASSSTQLTNGGSKVLGETVQRGHGKGVYATRPSSSEPKLASSRAPGNTHGRGTQLARPTAPLRVLMVLPRSAAMLSKAEALAACQDLDVAFLGNLTDVSEQKLSHFDLLLVWPESLSRERVPTLLRLSRSIRTVLLVDRGTLLEGERYLDSVDACVFVDRPLDRQVAALAMARTGYVLLPNYIGPTFAADQLRLLMVQSLTERERAVLDVLRGGMSNSEIGRELNLSETAVKSVVRALLHKLHFRNRTEAAIFALRWSSAIRAQGEQGGADESGGSKEGGNGA